MQIISEIRQADAKVKGVDNASLSDSQILKELVLKYSINVVSFSSIYLNFIFIIISIKNNGKQPFMPSNQHNNSRISYFTFYKNRIKLLNIKQLH